MIEVECSDIMTQVTFRRIPHNNHPIILLWRCDMGCLFKFKLWFMFSLSSCSINSLVPGRFKVNFRWVNFKLILVVNGWGISHETVLIWMSLDHTYGKSTLVQVMAWCRQATSHYLSQCRPRSLAPHGATRPQWVKPTLSIKLLLVQGARADQWVSARKT